MEPMMPELAVADPVLTRLRAALHMVYGESLDRVVLFGSRARGDFRPDSDYDVAVFIRNPGSRWDEMGRIAHVTTEFLLDTDAFISAKPFDASRYDGDTSPLMRAIRRDGVDF